MSKKALTIASAIIVTTIFFAMAYIAFNLFGISLADTRKYELNIKTETLEKLYDGTPLTSDVWSIESGQVIPGHTLEYTMNSTITIPGVIQNKIGITIYDENGFNITNNYNIIYDLGTLTVRGLPLTISTASSQKNYDGETLSNSNWSLDSGTLLEGHSLFTIMNSEITYPGEIDNEIGVTITDQQGKNLTYIYEITYDLGKLTVHSLQLTIATETLEKNYDGTLLTSQNWFIQSGTVLSTHHLVATMNSSIIDPGTIDNEIGITILDQNNEDITRVYTITYKLGHLTVYKLNLVINTETKEKLYDGFALTSDIWHVQSGSILSNHHIDHAMTSTITNPGTIDNEVAITIYDQSNRDVTYVYNIIYQLGKLSIYQLDLTIQTETLEKVYDGTALTSDGWLITRGQISILHRIEYEMISSITTPGQVTNQIIITIYDENDLVVTSGYNISYNLGTLTITANQLTIQTETLVKAYDGTALTSQGWTLLSGTISSNHELNFVMNASITDPGTIENEIFITIIDQNNFDVTRYYEITYLIGTLTVTSFDISIYTETLEKVYDGTPLTSDGWGLLTGVIFQDHHIDYVMNSSITNPGTIANQIYITILDSQNRDVTYLYNIDYVYGTLTVDQIVVILQSASDSKIYDGTPLSNNEWTIINGELLANHEIFVSLDAEITDVGQIDNDMFVYVLDQNGTNVTNYYEFVYDTGKLTILSGIDNQTATNISTDSFTPLIADAFQFYTSIAGMIYFRGTSYESYNMHGWNLDIANEVDITVNPLNFSTLSYNALNQDSYDIDIEYIMEQVPYLLPYITNETLNGIEDYHIYGDTTQISHLTYMPYTYKSGDFLTLRDTINNTQELIYRQYVHDTYLDIPQSTFDAMLQLASDHNISANSSTLVSDIQRYIQTAATYNLNFAPIPSDVEDIAIYFLTVSKEGICQHYATAAALMYRAFGIPARYVTGFVGYSQGNEWAMVTTETAHAWVEIYIDGFGWVPIEVTGGGAVGGSPNQNNGEVLGELTIAPENIKALYEEGTVITPNNLLINGFSQFAALGYSYQVTFSGSLSEPGIAVSNIASFVVYDELGQNITSKFNITYLSGLLQLYLYEITLQTDSDQKIYDGQPLINENYSIIGDLLPGHYVENITFSSLLINVGISKNKATLLIFDEFGNDVTPMYNILSQYGNLMIAPRSITIVSLDDQKVYDGLALTNDTYQLLTGELVVDQVLTVVISGSQTNIGKSINTIDSVTITFNGEDVTSNYNINIIEGELTVSPA